MLEFVCQTCPQRLSRRVAHHALYHLYCVSCGPCSKISIVRLPPKHLLARTVYCPPFTKSLLWISIIMCAIFLAKIQRLLSPGTSTHDLESKYYVCPPTFTELSQLKGPKSYSVKGKEFKYGKMWSWINQQRRYILSKRRLITC